MAQSLEERLGGRKWDRNVSEEMEGCEDKLGLLYMVFLVLAGWGSRGSRLQREGQ